MSTLLELKDIRFSYGKAEALHGVSLSLGKGQIATVIGANGAGKTTLLLSAMGLLAASGQTFLDGEDISRLTTEERVERGMCLVPEQRELFGDMSVLDNLLLGAYVRRRDRSFVQQGLERVFVQFPRLKERRQQEAQTLSGGERQMLALGRALMSEPRLLLLDEPSLGLAPTVVKSVLEQVAALRQTGVSVLLIEQNARAALNTAEYAYVMDGGVFVLEGPAGDMAKDPRVTATYLGGAVE